MHAQQDSIQRLTSKFAQNFLYNGLSQFCIMNSGQVLMIQIQRRFEYRTTEYRKNLNVKLFPSPVFSCHLNTYWTAIQMLFRALTI